MMHIIYVFFSEALRMGVPWDQWRTHGWRMDQYYESMRDL